MHIHGCFSFLGQYPRGGRSPHEGVVGIGERRLWTGLTASLLFPRASTPPTLTPRLASSPSVGVTPPRRAAGVQRATGSGRDSDAAAPGGGGRGRSRVGDSALDAGSRWLAPGAAGWPQAGCDPEGPCGTGSLRSPRGAGAGAGAVTRAVQQCLALRGGRLLLRQGRAPARASLAGEQSGDVVTPGTGADGRMAAHRVLTADL